MQENSKEMNFTEAVKYVGKVSICIKDNNKIIYEKKQHNTGTNNLLRFLINCVAGLNSNANNALRPAKISLFSEATNEDGELLDYNNDPDAWSEEYLCSIPLLYDTVPSIDTSVSGDYFVKFHFRIPFSFIRKSPTVVTRMALYPKFVNNYFIDRCAWVDLGDSSFQIPANAPLGYTILVDWELHFINTKNQVTSNQ